MRKALLPMIASLALCGGATIALVASTARAEQSPKHPQMVALAAAPSLDIETATPPAEGGAPDMPMPPPPREGLKRLCNDMVARETGQLAYLEAKLALTPAQAPLYGCWKSVKLDLASKHQSECATAIADRKPGARGDLLAGMALEEKLLKVRLADLEAERPTLSALYAALTPDQKAEFGQAARHKMEGRMHMMMGMMDRRGPGMMGRPPMGHGPDGPGAPPPPQ